MKRPGHNYQVLHNQTESRKQLDFDLNSQVNIREDLAPFWLHPYQLEHIWAPPPPDDLIGNVL